VLETIVCPLQWLFSFLSDPPKWRRVERQALPPDEHFFDYEETLRRLGKRPGESDVSYTKADEVWYRDFVTSGFARPRWFAVYWVSQKRVARRNYTVRYFGWRFDSNFRGFIFPAIARQSKQTTPLHKGW